MNYKLKKFDIPVNVTRIANIHYFEFLEKYHTVSDYHNFCELVYVDKGEVFVSSENYSGGLKSGELIIHMPNEIHYLSCDIGAPNIIIIGFECESEALLAFCKKPYTLTSEEKKNLAELLREGMCVYTPPYDTPNLLDMKKRDEYPFGADQMIKLRLEMFIISIVRNNTVHKSQGMAPLHSDNTPEEIRRYIDEHFAENIQLDNICFIFGTNKTSLCNSFKKEFGITVLGYINNLKVKEAKHLLRESKLSVTEISEKLGFSSIHYFCKFFKKHTGDSPVAYSKTIRSKLNI